MRTKIFFILAFSLFSLNAYAQTTQTINGGVLTGKAIELVQPVYPAAARAVRASGAVNVQITIDETGSIISAWAVSGHPLLRQAAEAAARASKFMPVMISDQPVRVTGVIVYNFNWPVDWHYVGMLLGDSEIEIEDAGKLKRMVGEIRGQYPDEAKALQIVIENYEKDSEGPARQSIEIGQITRSLQTKIASQSRESWDFELGLTVGRLAASYFEDQIVRDSLTSFKALYDSAPETLDEDMLDALGKLSEMAGKNTLTRADKREIKALISNL